MNMSLVPRSPATTLRKGITLLEVLIAAGVLVVGLTSVLAIIPAAGSLFGEASMSDRAAALASNAAAELRFQGFFEAASFKKPPPPPPDPPEYYSAIVWAPSAVTSAAALSGTDIKPDNTVVDSLVDEAAYGRAGYAVILSPLVEGDAPTSGDRALATTVVFKSRSPETEEISLAKATSAGIALPPGVYRINNGSVSQQEDRRKRLMAPCSWVAVQKDGKVRWLHVGSSWTTYKWNATLSKLDTSDSFVSFTDTEAADAAIVNTVSAFAGVLRVEDQIIELD